MSVGGGRFGSVKSAAQGGGKAASKTAGKTAGKLRTARRLGTDAALAISGDARAIAKLAGKAALRVWRSPLARRLAFGGAVGAVMVLLVAAGGIAGGQAPAVDVSAARSFGASEMVWAAYATSGRVWCAPDGTVRVSSEVLQEPWQRADWRLVAAVGAVESGHAAGSSVNAFGDVWPLVLGPVLDGTIEGLVTIPDTDNGRFDLDRQWDRAVGPMQLLPATVVHRGVDGNGDGIIDPHNIWDATASASAYLCVAQTGTTVSQAVFAYNHSEVYVDSVLEGYVELVQRVEESDAGMLPAGAPLGYAPAVVEDAVLGSLVERLGGDVADVSCSDPGACAWLEDRRGNAAEGWQSLRELGYGAPVSIPGGIIASGDGRLRGLLPSMGAVSWPVPVSSPPQPPASRTPLWWAHAVPADSSEWIAAGAMTVTLPAAAGAAVYAPEAGEAGGVGDCGTVVGAAGWTWRLCGLRLDTPAASVVAGARIGTATGDSLQVELTGPDGRPACPQRLFGAWAAGDAAAPAGLAQQIDDARADAEASEDPDEAEAALDRAAALEAALYEECMTP